MKYIFLIDIDGTLVPICTNKVSDSLVSVIKNLQKKGHKFVVATGRSLGSSQKVIGTGDFDFYACLMGLVIYDNANKKYTQKINLLNHDALYDLIGYLIKGNRQWLYKDLFGDYTIIDDKEFMSYHNLKKVSIERMKKDFEDKNVFQVFVDGEIDENVKDKYKNNFDFIAVPNGKGSVHYDITAKNVDKSFIVKYFKENYKDYKIVAIGDSDNDLGMLKSADISVAMGNADEKIKNYCDYVTDTCDNDGVEKFLKEFIKD